MRIAAASAATAMSAPPAASSAAPRRRRAGARAPRCAERRVVAEDLALEVAARAGLEPQLLAQPPTGVLIGRQRVGLPPGAIEREHQLAAQPLA